MSIQLSSILDLGLLDRMVSEGYVRINTSETGISIYNYTQKAQYESVWNEATTTARGLIVSADGHVIARPFRKFFNLAQLGTIPAGTPVFDEKLDGSLGIGYRTTHGEPAIATRGSLTSDQAQWATAWLAANPTCADWVDSILTEQVTPLFEIIYPENRIVVEYGDRAELALLACIDIGTGRDIERCDWPGTFAAEEAITMDELSTMDEPNAEGYVLRWPCGTRAKAKFPNYVRLHKLLTGVNARTIWDLLANGQPLDDLLAVVPDEFYDWVHVTVAQLRTEFEAVEVDAIAILDSVPEGDRRSQAEFILARAENPSIIFAMLDDKPYADAIWRQIKPGPESQSFWNDSPATETTQKAPRQPPKR